MDKKEFIVRSWYGLKQFNRVLELFNGQLFKSIVDGNYIIILTSLDEFSEKYNRPFLVQPGLGTATVIYVSDKGFSTYG